MIQRRVAPTPILWYPPIVEAEVQVVVMILVVLVLCNSNNGSSTTSSTTTSSITSSSTRVVLLLLGDHTIGGGRLTCNTGTYNIHKTTYSIFSVCWRKVKPL